MTAKGPLAASSRSGRRRLLAVVAVLLFAGAVVTLSSSGILSGHRAATNSVSGGSTIPQAGDVLPYDCALPAAVSDLTCDVLPAGFVIPPKLPNSPTIERPAGMTTSAWTLFQKTFGSGVCTPNETFMTDPYDCAAYGDQINDPFTGRPGTTVSVCQMSNLEALNQAQGGAGAG